VFSTARADTVIGLSKGHFAIAAVRSEVDGNDVFHVSFSFSLVLVLLYSIGYSVVNTLVVKKIFQNVSVPVNGDPLTLITTGKEISDVEGTIPQIVSQSLRQQLTTDASNPNKSVGHGGTLSVEEVVQFVAVVDGDHFLVLLLSLTLISTLYRRFFSLQAKSFLTIS